MVDTREQARLREHWAEMRRATAGLGKDLAIEVEQLGTNIERLGTLTGKEAKYLLYDIEDESARLGRAIQVEARALPRQVAGAVVTAGERIHEGASRAADATKDAFEAAGKKAKEGTKNAFAKAAGVKRTPMKEWTADP